MQEDSGELVPGVSWVFPFADFALCPFAATSYSMLSPGSPPSDGGGLRHPSHRATVFVFYITTEFAVSF